MNRSVVEVENLRPKLRDGLRFSVQGIGGERMCLIEDPHGSRFHRLGLTEFRFARTLDGTRTVASILAQLARDGRGESFTEQEALQILRWLKDNQLLAVESSRAGSGDGETERALWSAASWLNPLIAKIPLARPDRFFSSVEPALRWVLGRFGFALWIIVILIGAGNVAMEWSRFAHDFTSILARDNWLWMLVVWIALKIAHEFSHGLFCKHYGAPVREVGVIFMLFVPMGYVDATASIGLASKWRRMMVSAAGLYMEFFLAAIAAIVWAHSPDGLTATLAHNAIVTGTVVTLFFNANPLMRFDGYYILSDLIGIPNLATRGRQWFQRAVAWLLFGGERLRPEKPDTAREWFASIYGIASAFWQVAVAAGLIAAASSTLKGGGLFFAVIAGGAWVVLPLLNFARTLRGAAGHGRWMQFAWRVALLVAVVCAALFTPFRRSVSSPGVVELADTIVMRAECPGFVEKLYVRDGDLVIDGQLLAELRNDEATAKLERSRLDLAAQELRARVAYARNDVAAYQAENAKTEAMRTTVANHEKYAATLQLRAPFAGRITGRQLDRLDGAFLRAGDEFARIGKADANEVKIALRQDVAPHFRDAMGSPLRVRIEGRSVIDATLTRVESRATRELIHPALTALAGGPLALRKSEEAATNRDAEDGQYELAEPYFVAVARVDAAVQLNPGEPARVKLRGAREVTLWKEFQGAFARWLERHTQKAELP